MRIDQLLGSIVSGDAISAHAAELSRLLRARGIESDIYVQEAGAEPRDDVAALPADILGTQADALIYHLSVGSDLINQFLSYPGRRIALYHNVTPARYFEGWDPPMVDIMRAGRRDLRRAAVMSHFGIADSEFNRAEMVAAGFSHTGVLPILMNPGDHDVPPDAELAANLGRRKTRGPIWLFVGRFAPNKGQSDVVKAFTAFRRASGHDATLLLIGAPTTGSYYEAVVGLAHQLGVEDAVVARGPVSPAELSACYRAADVFVCLSEHEGFCAPVVEAMYHQVPVVAYRAGAVPETAGDGAVLLDDKDPVYVAAVVEEVIGNEGLRTELVERGSARAAELSVEQTSERLDQLISEILR